MELMIAACVILAGFAVLYFTSSPGQAADPYQCLRDHPDEKQETFIRDVFDLARKKGGLWRIDFYSHYVVVHTWSGRSLQFLNSKLGYDNVAMNRVVTANGSSQGYYEFAHRVKRAAENREALCWVTRGALAASTADTSTSTDAREDGSPVISVHVCTVEYDRTYNPRQGASD